MKNEERNAITRTKNQQNTTQTATPERHFEDVTARSKHTQNTTNRTKQHH
jgi:hypothetical protein